jgi:hypothetical protein
MNKEEAKRSSKNRSRGTMVTKNIETVNKEKYFKALIGKVIPEIKAKWPKGSKGMLIKIKQDHAKPDFSPEDPAVMEAGTADG